MCDAEDDAAIYDYREVVMLFAFAQNALWDPDRRAALVGYEVNRCGGKVVIPATTFAVLFGSRPLSPVACVEAYHMHRIEFEKMAEALYRSGIVEANGDIVIEPMDLAER